MIPRSRYDPPTRELVEQMASVLSDVSGKVDEIHADQRSLMVEVFGKGTSHGLKTRVRDLEISQSVGKRWIAAVTTLISAIIVTVVTTVKAVFFNN